MADVRTCKKCSQSIDAKVEPYSVCEGQCASCFHASCVGLTEDDLCTMALKVNLIWMCDQCMTKFRRMSDGTWTDSTTNPVKTKSIEDEVEGLKVTVAGILETLSKLAPTVVRNDHAPLHSTPVSSHKPFEEMNTSNIDVNTAGNEQQSQHMDGGDFSLFLSNIDTSVSELDVYTMVSRSLNIPDPEDIDVLKLVSNFHHRKPPDFISFKITLDRKWKSKALNPLSWPKHVKFREFITRRNVTWLPE